MLSKRTLCVFLALLLCLPLIPVMASEGENPEFKTYFFDDFFTGYEPGETTIKGGYVNSLGAMSRREETNNGFLRLVNLTKNNTGGDFVNNLGKIEGKPKLVFEFRYNPNLNNSSAHYKNATGGTETFYAVRGTNNGYYEKQNGTKMEAFAAAYMTEWHTATIIYDNEKEERTIFINDNKYGPFAGNSYAKTGNFVLSAYAATSITGHFDIDYLALYEYQDIFEFIIEDSGKTATDKISILFNFPVKPETVLPENFAIDGNRVISATKDILNPRRYELTFETPLSNGSDYKISATGIIDIDEREIATERSFHTKDAKVYLNDLKIESLDLSQPGTYTVSATSLNETDAVVNASALISVYDENDIVTNVHIVPLSVPVGEDNITGELILDSATEKITVFAVSSLETLTPISDKVVYDKSGENRIEGITDSVAYKGLVDVTFDTNYEEGVVFPKIEITDMSKRDGIIVVLNEDDVISEDNLVYADMFTVCDGKAELSIKLDETASLFARTSLNKVSGVIPGSFDFYNRDYIINEALPALNKATLTTEVAEFIDNYATACELDMDFYYDGSEPIADYVLQAILDTKAELNGNYASTSQLREKLEGIAQLADFYYGDSSLDDVTTALTTLIDDSAEIIWKDELSEETKKEVETFLKANVKYVENQFINAFEEACVLIGIKNAQHYKQTRTLINTCMDLIGITPSLMTKYTGLYHEEKVDQALTGKGYDNFTLLINAFSSAVDNQQRIERTAASGGTGGGGGSVSRPSANPGQTVLLPNATNRDDSVDPFENEETENKTDESQEQLPVEPVGTLPFKDIQSVPWAKSAIRYLYIKKAVQGKDETQFAPNDTVTRAEFITMTVKAFDLKNQSTENPFADVSVDDWYYDTVLVAYNSGIVSGTTSETFAPNSHITREMAAAILYKIAGTNTSLSENTTFSDMGSVSDYAKEAVGKLAGKGIISGYEDGTFRPEKTLTRAEAAVLIFRMLTGI